MDSLTYLQHGDYLIPNLTLSEQPDGSRLPEMQMGKYGLMRRTYLKDHRPILYNSLLLKEQLYPHLIEIEQTASARVEQLMTELLEQSPPPDKATDTMAWTAHMNSLKQQAEELTLTELVYS
ncbi:TnpV protein [Eubacteriales bacterium OttesenSCG-928-N13]|nr:TnpV protein [Eubacteriales bacterium OttesenSCG-928-N13]